MSTMNMASLDPAVACRAAQIESDQLKALQGGTDRMFMRLMLVQWLAGILIAVTIAPKTWIGTTSAVHLHVWAAILLGGAICLFPAFLAWRRPGAATTRQTIAVAQMCWSSLLIHLTGGRVETHFHVFGSLAFLAIYRDCSVLITASVVVAADHFIRGVWWPQSVFGIFVGSPYRWLEHGGWVAFEDVFLIAACVRSRADMKASAVRMALLEDTNRRVEATVALRTEELRTARDAAETANRSKSEFLANMSHEIRTPMTAIVGFADLLLEADQSASDRVNCVQTIRRNGEHLLAIINDILDLSKIEAGKLVCEEIECSPVQIVVDVASLLRVRAISRQLAFTVDFEGPIPRTIRTDPTRLRQILMNLIGNAIKFTDAGGVRIVIRLVDDDPARTRLRFDIIDSGIGITPPQMNRLFQPFTQSDASTTRRFGGTGLGLSISRRLAQMLGGDIVAQSAPGSGSIFSLEIRTGSLEGVERFHPVFEAMLPAGPGEAAAAPAEGQPAGALSMMRVLLAEDGIDNQRLISFILRKAGAEVTIAENGVQACTAALSAVDSGMPFDVILMDMQMPELDGYGATSKLRAKGYRGCVIALTAHAMTGDREKCLHAGCDDYISKPVDRAALIALLVAHRDRAAAPRAAASKNAAA